jgi:hypothetical protein
MKIRPMIMLCSAATVLSGCGTPDLFRPTEPSAPPISSFDDYRGFDYNPPPKANRVQIMRYDSTYRPSTTELDVFGQIPPTRPYKVIALLTCEGRLDQEVVMTTAIYYQARQIGADGVINPNAVATQGDPTLHVADTVQKQVIMNPIGLEGNGQRCVFRAYAIVYTSGKAE